MSSLIDGRCLGSYCGRMLDATGNFSDCGACPSGYRSDANSICQKCTGQPSFYDWMYLAFMAFISLGLHWFFIDWNYRRSSYRVILLHVCALAESVLAAVFALLVIEPLGSLTVTSCPATQLSDWYTLFQNPSLDHVHTVYCTQEAVYPLYSLVFIYYAFSLVCMMLTRPLISVKLVQNAGTKSIYAALYFFPVLICLHAILAGFIYYSFAYIVIIVSMLTNAVHFSNFLGQTMRSLLREHFSSARNVVILLAHWLLHVFGLVALTQLRNISVHGWLLCLVPLPALFYVLTVKFTDPSNLDRV